MQLGPPKILNVSCIFYRFKTAPFIQLWSVLLPFQYYPVKLYLYKFHLLFPGQDCGGAPAQVWYLCERWLGPNHHLRIDGGLFWTLYSLGWQYISITLWGLVYKCVCWEGLKLFYCSTPKGNCPRCVQSVPSLFFSNGPDQAQMPDWSRKWFENFEMNEYKIWVMLHQGDLHTRLKFYQGLL